MEIKPIVLCSLNSKFIHSSPAVYYIRDAFMRQFPEQKDAFTVLNATVNDTLDHILYMITERCPVIVGFSVYIWNIDIVTKLCKVLRRIDPDIKIILGGPEVSYGVGHTNLKKDDYDFLVCGEGENAFPAAVCACLGIDKSFDVTISGKTVTANKNVDLNEIPLIYNDGNITEFKDKIIYYETSRGCPFSCAYCLSSVCGKVRLLDEKRVFSDIDFFIKQNVKQVKFVDRTFNCSPGRAYRIWEYIISKADLSETNFHFEIGADLLTDEQIELLSHAPKGKIQLEAGIQTVNERSLKEVCRYAPTDVVLNNLRRLIESGNINIHTDLIAGLPYEDFESFKNSLNCVYDLNSHQLQLGFLKLLSGAPLNGMIDKHGYYFAPYPPYEIIKNKYITYEQIKRLKEIEDVIEKLYNSGRFILSLKKLRQMFVTPFDMLCALADYLKERGILFAPASTKKLFDAVGDFAKKSGESIDCVLLEDFYLSENSEIPPQSLKELVPLNKLTKPKAYEITHSLSLQKQKAVFVKFIGNEALIIDYSKKDPVTGRFALIGKKEVDFNE